MKLIKKETIFVLSLCLAAFFIASISSIKLKSPTCDEAAHHISTGYVFLTHGDLRFSTEAPPLPRYIAAMPLLFMNIDMPDERSFWAREDRAEFSRELLYERNRNLAGTIFFAARLMMIFLGASGGIFLFFWVLKKYDYLTAVITGIFYFSSPNILAHSRLATTDISITVFGIFAVLLFWDYINNITIRGAVLAGIFTGFVLLSKFTALIFLPVFFMYYMIFIREKVAQDNVRKRMFFFSAVVYLLVAFFVLWSGYLFEWKPFLEDTLRSGNKRTLILETIKKFAPFISSDNLNIIERSLYSTRIPLSSFLLGILGIIKHSADGTRSFFLGTWSNHGHPLYFITAFLIKTPISVILSFFVGVFVTLRYRENRKFGLYMLTFILAFFVIASRSNLQIGVRYILPVYPFIFIFASVGIVYLFKKSVFLRLFSIIILIWFMLSSVRIWPDYLSYFNELIGGPDNGYKFLRDSNIDWGQDLPALKKYMDDNDIDSIRLDYFGEGDVALFGIKKFAITKDELLLPENDIYAISVHHLDAYSWTKNRVPDAKAGYSIHIYDLRNKK